MILNVKSGNFFLQEKRNDPANIGRIKYSLSYDPPTNKVILEVIKAKVDMDRAEK